MLVDPLRTDPAQLIDNFFRHEYGRLVATLSRRVGVQHLELVEDAVQSALRSALESWTMQGVPEHTSAWLFRVAHNEVLGALRKQNRRRGILERNAFQDGGSAEEIAGFLVKEVIVPDSVLAGELNDDLLRMLFVCCDDAIPVESQLVLALKTLCGFDVREIALRLFLSEANVYKRLGRARHRLREFLQPSDELCREDYSARLPSVQKILYLLFSEGYLSVRAETTIRQELCHEALRLTNLLAEHHVGQTPETFALLALMHLHQARMHGRRDSTGGLLLLEEQDRDLWDQTQLHVGLAWLAKSAEGGVFSRYHAEAGIAAEHGLSRSFEETRWDRVVACYELLEQVAPSFIHTLNRAVALAQWKGPRAGLAVIEGIDEAPKWLVDSYPWSAVLADLHRRSGNELQARHYRERALSLAPTAGLKELMRRRFGLELPES